MHKTQGESMMGRPLVEGAAILPSFSITTKDLPEAKDWKVGKKYTIKMNVTLTGQNKLFVDPLTPSAKDLRCNFEINSVGEDSPDQPAGKNGYA